MRLMVIVNTSASSVTPRARVVVQKALSTDHEIVMKETSRRGHASRLAQSAVTEGFDAVVVLAGDGTLNEAANGLVGSNTALAALPGGSTNVFARTVGMSPDPIEATDQLLAALAKGSQERVGLGQANGRYFLLHAGIGFDAAVVAAVDRFGALKRYAGPAAFALAAMSLWAKGYDRKSPAFSISAGDLTVPGAYYAICENSDPYTFVGNRPLLVAPATRLGGPLSLVVFDKLTLSTLLPAFAAALDGGVTRSERGHLRSVTRVHGATVTGLRPVPYQIDGEYAGEAERIELAWSEGQLSLVVPEAVAAGPKRRRERSHG